MQTLANKYAAKLGLVIDEVLVLHLADTKLLVAAAAGKIDLNKLAREELDNRFLGLDGKPHPATSR